MCLSNFSHDSSTTKNAHHFMKKLGSNSMVCVLTTPVGHCRVSQTLESEGIFYSYFSSMLIFPTVSFMTATAKNPASQKYGISEYGAVLIWKLWTWADSSPSVQQAFLCFPQKFQISFSALWVRHCALEFLSIQFGICGSNDCHHKVWEGILPKDWDVSFGGWMGMVKTDVLGTLKRTE